MAPRARAPRRPATPDAKRPPEHRSGGLSLRPRPASSREGRNLSAESPSCSSPRRRSCAPGRSTRRSEARVRSRPCRQRGTGSSRRHPANAARTLASPPHRRRRSPRRPRVARPTLRYVSRAERVGRVLKNGEHLDRRRRTYPGDLGEEHRGDLHVSLDDDRVGVRGARVVAVPSPEVITRVRRRRENQSIAEEELGGVRDRP